MQQIEHRVLLSLIIARRGIDCHTTSETQRGRVVPHLCHVTMCHVVVGIEIALVAHLTTHDKGAHKGPHITTPLDIGRVESLHSIDIEAIVVKLGKQHGRRIAPAVTVLSELGMHVFHTIANNVHTCSVGGTEAESNCPVVIKTRRTLIATFKDGFLSHSLCRGQHKDGQRHAKLLHIRFDFL